MSNRRDPRVAIIGAGMSGLCVAAKLRAAGMDDIVIYEKSDRVGGTWRENTYPGLACDVPSRYYSYSFAPNPHWTHVFSPGPEIQEYLRRVARDLDLERHIRFSTEVDEAEWVEGRWRVRAKDGTEESFDFLVSAAGVLHHPRVAEIPGMEDFRRCDVPLGPLGPLGALGRAPGCGHRVGLDRDADHRRALAAVRRVQALRTHPAVGVSDAEPPLQPGQPPPADVVPGPEPTLERLQLPAVPAAGGRRLRHRGHPSRLAARDGQDRVPPAPAPRARPLACASGCTRRTSPPASG